MRLVLLLFVLLAACTANSGVPDEGVDAAEDVVNDLAPADARAPLPPWNKELPAASSLSDNVGGTLRRVIIHAHSVHSHDACDGNPYVDGGVNEPCLQSLRRALCRTRIDVLFLTEHAGHLAEGSFERSMQLRAGDEPVRQDGALVGYTLRCADGHQTLVLPGAENELMPLALLRHPTPPMGATINDAYHADGPEGAALFRATGALVAVPHVEQRELAYLQQLRPDLVEVYNVHANLDPRIAEPALGLNVGELLSDVARFAFMSSRLEPDLVFLGFFRENQNDLRKWSSLLFNGMMIPGIAASDAHENTIRAILVDGERGDSYRRVFRWFSNLLRVDGALTRENVLNALRSGRVTVVFDAFGSPNRFSYVAQTSSERVQIGGSVLLTNAPTLVVQRPSVFALDASLPAPTMRMRILRAEASDWREVAAGTDETLRFTPTMPGAYRAEVRINPLHVRPYLPGMERLVTEVPWVVSSAIYVR